MDHSEPGPVEMFMSVTGASEAVALEKLQAYGGDLNAAINSFFNEGETPFPQMRNEDTNRIDWMEEDESVPRQPSRPFVPAPYPFPSAPAWATGLHAASGLGVEDMGAPQLPMRNTAPFVSQPRDVREVPIDWKDEEEPRVRPHPGPLIEEIPATADDPQIASQSHGHIIIDDEDVPSTASSILRGGGDAAGRSLFGSNTFTGEFPSRNPSLNAPMIDELPAMASDEGNDIEEEMLRAAIEASKKEAEAATRRGLSGAGPDESRMQTEDDDLARAVSLSLKTAEREKALRESQGYLGAPEAGLIREEADHGSPDGHGKKHDISKRWGSTSTSDNLQIDIGTPLNSLSADDSNFQNPISGANIALSSPTEEVEELDEQPLLRRRSGHRLPPALDSAISQPGLAAPRQASSSAATTASDDVHLNAPLERNGDVLHNDEWGGISSEEQEEAVMLEAAMFGSLPEDAALRFHYPSIRGVVGDADAHLTDDTGTHNYSRPIPQPPSPTVVAQRRLREQQDDEYLASLEADREKELKAQFEAEAHRLKEAEAKAAAHAEEKLRQEEDLQKQLAKEELKRQSAAKRAALPEEPSLDDTSGVTLLVRMPNGSRVGRRFHKSDTLQCLFDFIDVSGGILPGSYRLVRQYPRTAFTDAEHGYSFSDLGLTSKHEALFLELI